MPTTNNKLILTGKENFETLVKEIVKNTIETDYGLTLVDNTDHDTHYINEIPFKWLKTDYPLMVNGRVRIDPEKYLIYNEGDSNIKSEGGQLELTNGNDSGSIKRIIIDTYNDELRCWVAPKEESSSNSSWRIFHIDTTKKEDVDLRGGGQIVDTGYSLSYQGSKTWYILYDTGLLINFGFARDMYDSEPSNKDDNLTYPSYIKAQFAKAYENTDYVAFAEQFFFNTTLADTGGATRSECISHKKKDYCLFSVQHNSSITDGNDTAQSYNWYTMGYITAPKKENTFLMSV